MLADDAMRPGRAKRLEREQATRARVLDAAEAEFALSGFDDARIHGIADRARVALGTLYGLYPSKQDVHVAVHERRLGALFASVADAMSESTTAIGMIRTGMRAWVAYFCAHPSYLAMHLRDGQAWSTTTHLRSEVQRQGWARGMEMMRALFTRAAAEGAMRSGTADRDARVAIATQQVFMAEWLESTERSTPDALFEASWEVVERAFVLPSAQMKDVSKETAR